MEMTLLERSLDEYLPTIGVELSRRDYGEWRDMRVDMGRGPSSPAGQDSFFDSLDAAAGNLPSEAYLYGRQPFFVRSSSIPSRMEFCIFYSIHAADHNTKQASKIGDLILTRNFLTEALCLGLAYPEHTGGPPQDIKDIYGDPDYLDFTVFVRDDDRILVCGLNQEETPSEQEFIDEIDTVYGCNLAPLIRALDRYEDRTLDEATAQELMQDIGRIVQEVRRTR